jgi:hypothetical protein
MWKVNKREDVIKGMGRGAFEEIGVSHKGRYMRSIVAIPKLYKMPEPVLKVELIVRKC